MSTIHPLVTSNARLEGIETLSQNDIADLDIHAACIVWENARADAFAPTRAAFPLDGLPWAVIPRVALIDIVGPPLDFFYRFFGTAMAEAAGVELTGKRYYADGIESYGFANACLLPELIERRQPMYNRVTWTSARGLPFSTTTARMPLSDDGETVTSVVTVNHYSRSPES